MEASSRRGRRLWSSAAGLLRETARTSTDLFKIMVPISIAMRLLDQLGVIARLGEWLGPVMRLVGLPGEMGLVWATAMGTNLYGGMIAFASVAPKVQLTAAGATVLTTMMLVAHALPLELRIAQKAGARLRFMGLLRVAGALLLGWMLHQFYRLTGLLAGPSRALFHAPPAEATWATWAGDQARKLLMIFLIILVLLFLMKLLKRVGVTDLLGRLLAPILRLLGMSGAAAPVTIIGMTLGLSYGGGLIIQEAKSGRLGKRDVFFSLTLMGLCHSLFEDTLLMMALGGRASGVLWGRLIFALLVTGVLVRLLGRVSEETFDRLLYRPHKLKRPPAEGPAGEGK